MSSSYSLIVLVGVEGGSSGCSRTKLGSAMPCISSWHLRSGSWFVAFLCLIVHNCPCDCACVQLFAVPYSFFVSVAVGDVCPGASAQVEGPRSPPFSPETGHKYERCPIYTGREGAALSPKTKAHQEESEPTGLAKFPQFTLPTSYSLTYHVPP